MHTRQVGSTLRAVTQKISDPPPLATRLFDGVVARGRIYIVDAEGDTPSDPEIDLYEPLEFDEFDEECGTFGSSDYAPADGGSLKQAAA